jgi:hypothetical protein
MLQVSKICWDMALMEYGPAVQASIGGIHLIDKIHTGCSGEYLELISTDNAADMITLLYRKVGTESDWIHPASFFFSANLNICHCFMFYKIFPNCYGCTYTNIVTECLNIEGTKIQNYYEK